MPDEIEPDVHADVDLEALRAVYARERERRMHPDGQKQYVEATGLHAHYESDDPHLVTRIVREPLADELEVVIIGAGFAGMMTAARLRAVGVTDIRIVEAGSDFGGTWYWNRYPGAQCDIESYIYLPLLEETGYLPKEKYSYGPEIFEHSQRIAKHFGLHEVACFQTRVTALTWDEALKRWHVATDRGDDMRPRFVITCLGPASRPKLPGIPGLDDFTGAMFHTSRWDYGFTGGDTYGNLHKLADKRVAIVGTGASAIQVVPHVGRDAAQTIVFQRTPSWVDVRGNRPTDPAWAASLQPGWQRARQENFNAVVTGMPVEEDLVDDSWTDAKRYGGLLTVTDIFTKTLEEMMLTFEVADARKMTDVRGRVDAVVTDAATAEALKPWYRRHCKRPTFHDDYLPTFNLPTVTLVDTSGSHGVERITETGIVAGGVEYEVDLIVFATDFEISTGLRRKTGFDVLGRDGLSMFDHYVEHGLSTLHGHSSRGFPNFFNVGASQNGVSPNWTSMTDEHTVHVAHIIGEVLGRGFTTVEPTAEAEAAWVETVHETSAASNDLFEACTPGYYNNEGRISEGESRFFGELYQPGVTAFNELLAQWRAAGDLAGLELSR